MAAPHRRALVRPHQPPGRDRHRNRRLVSRRPAARADPLAPGARPNPGELETHAFLATDLDVTPQDMLQWFVRRWQIEVTFEEVRAHLGVETQRQWSDRAILRTTPTLLGLFSLVCLWGHDLYAACAFAPRTAAWYPKAHLTFSDTIAAVRRQIWRHQNSCTSRTSAEHIKIPRTIWERMTNALAYAA